MSCHKPARLIVLSLLLALATLSNWTAPAGAQDTSIAPPGALEIVVKLAPEGGTDITDLTETLPTLMSRPLLASRGLFLMVPTDAETASDAKKADKLAKAIEKSDLVQYAELYDATGLSDTRYHSWTEGAPVELGDAPEPWLDQPLSGTLNLRATHELATGAGTIVAVLDTGVDSTHPAIAERLLPGYDYVDDDSDPSESRMQLDSNRNGVVDEAFGHGTFVSGVVGLVAPDARVLPYRVLDSDGVGSVFVVAEAIGDAIERGADVINLSMGTSTKIDTKVVDDALKAAKKRGVVVVVAAGNAASDKKQYPAEDKNVISVASVESATQGLSRFSSWGGWVDVAAPADFVVGPVPGGGYARWAGTSMAAPQVSGQVALIRSRVAQLGVDRELDAVTKTSHKLISKAKPKHGSIDLLASLAAADKHG